MLATVKVALLGTDVNWSRGLVRLTVSWKCRTRCWPRGNRCWQKGWRNRSDGSVLRRERSGIARARGSHPPRRCRGSWMPRPSRYAGGVSVHDGFGWWLLFRRTTTARRFTSERSHGRRFSIRPSQNPVWYRPRRRRVRCRRGPTHRRHEEAGQEGDERDHHQELEEGEGAGSTPGVASRQRQPAGAVDGGSRVLQKPRVTHFLTRRTRAATDGTVRWNSCLGPPALQREPRAARPWRRPARAAKRSLLEIQLPHRPNDEDNTAEENPGIQQPESHRPSPFPLPELWVQGTRQALHREQK